MEKMEDWRIESYNKRERERERERELNYVRLFGLMAYPLLMVI